MKIYLGTDHAGYDVKEKIKEFLVSKNFEVVDCGAFEYDKLDDYPDFCSAAAEGVSNSNGSFGFVFGKSGTGEMIVANKIRGVRCALAVNEDNVRLSREHNDCNMLSFGSDFIDLELMKQLSLVFINTDFSNEERHIRRVNKIKQIESK